MTYLGIDFDDDSPSPPRAKPGDLVNAARTDNVALVEALLAQGADIEEKDSSGDTPLNEAARCNKLEVVRLLLEKGAQVNAPNQRGQTALVWAEGYHYTDIVEALKEATKEQKALAQQPQEKWLRQGEEKVARVNVYPQLHKRLTDIFDFASRERVLISDDLQTNASAMTPVVSFDELAPSIYETALAHFQELGGKADAEFVRRGNRRLDKKGLG